MAISRVSNATAQSSAITIPSHQAGDLIFIAASRANTTAPTVPAGWVQLSSSGGSGVSLVTAAKYAQSASEAAAVFSNAGVMNCAIYRSSVGIVFPSMATVSFSGTSATVTYAALGNYKTGVDANWYLGIAAQINTANALETAPSGMANVNVDSITGLKAALHDTNTNQLSNWASTNVGPLTNSAAYRTAVVQLCEMLFAFPSGGGGIFFRPGMSGGMCE